MSNKIVYVKPCFQFENLMKPHLQAATFSSFVPTVSSGITTCAGQSCRPRKNAGVFSYFFDELRGKYQAAVGVGPRASIPQGSRCASTSEFTTLALTVSSILAAEYSFLCDISLFDWRVQGWEKFSRLVVLAGYIILRSHIRHCSVPCELDRKDTEPWQGWSHAPFKLWTHIMIKWMIVTIKTILLLAWKFADWGKLWLSSSF